MQLVTITTKHDISHFSIVNFRKWKFQSDNRTLLSYLISELRPDTKLINQRLRTTPDKWHGRTVSLYTVASHRSRPRTSVIYPLSHRSAQGDDDDGPMFSATSCLELRRVPLSGYALRNLKVHISATSIDAPPCKSLMVLCYSWVLELVHFFHLSNNITGVNK